MLWYNSRVMETQENQPKKPRRGGSIPPASSGGPSLWMQLAIAFAVFLVLSTGYSLVREYLVNEKESVPLSQIAADITQGHHLLLDRKNARQGFSV